jgi:Tfp pilus assembly major pilin PilA
MKGYSGNQKGLTLISILVILFVIGFFALLTLKIAPIYFNHFKVMDAMASLKKEGGLETYSKAKILDTVQKRLDVNMVDHIRSEDITIEKSPTYVSVVLDYEVTENIFGNLDVLVYFTEKYEAGSR